MSQSIDATAEAAVQPCHMCGGPAPYNFGEVWLCLDCYHIAGSTCSGIGRVEEPVDPVC